MNPSEDNSEVELEKPADNFEETDGRPNFFKLPSEQRYLGKLLSALSGKACSLESWYCVARLTVARRRNTWNTPRQKNRRRPLRNAQKQSKKTNKTDIGVAQEGI
jgi:hypothetical protein